MTYEYRYVLYIYGCLTETIVTFCLKSCISNLYIYICIYIYNMIYIYNCITYIYIYQIYTYIYRSIIKY